MELREALLAAAGRNEVYGWAKGFNLTARRWMRMDRVLLQNPYTGHAEAVVYCYDIQDQVCSEKMMRIVADRFFEFIGLGTVRHRLAEVRFYTTMLRLRGYGGAMKLKRVTCTYLVETRTTIVMAQSDMTDMEQMILGGVPRDRHTAERKRCQ